MPELRRFYDSGDRPCKVEIRKLLWEPLEEPLASFMGMTGEQCLDIREGVLAGKILPNTEIAVIEQRQESAVKAVQTLSDMGLQVAGLITRSTGDPHSCFCKALEKYVQAHRSPEYFYFDQYGECTKHCLDNFHRLAPILLRARIIAVTFYCGNRSHRPVPNLRLTHNFQRTLLQNCRDFRVMGALNDVERQRLAENYQDRAWEQIRNFTDALGLSRLHVIRYLLYQEPGFPFVFVHAQIRTSRPR